MSSESSSVHSLARTSARRSAHSGLPACLALVLAILSSACLEPVVLGDGRSMRDPDPPDAATDAADEPDPIDPEAPRFTAPTLIEALVGDADLDDDDPSLNRALTWIFFNSTRDGGAGREDIWFSQRPSPSEPWSAPEPATALNTDARETGMALSADGLTIYWSSDREGGAGLLDVYTSTRATLEAPWSAPVAVTELNTSGDDLVSAVTDEGRLLLLSRRDGDSGYYLAWSRRTARSDPWSAPEPIDELNTGSGESDPFLVRAGTQLLFARDGDLFVASRASEDAPFGEAIELSTLNSEDGDTDPWSDEDLSYVVFASDRSGQNRIYEARRE